MQENFCNFRKYCEIHEIFLHSKPGFAKLPKAQTVLQLQPANYKRYTTQSKDKAVKTPSLDKFISVAILKCKEFQGFSISPVDKELL